MTSLRKASPEFKATIEGMDKDELLKFVMSYNDYITSVTKDAEKENGAYPMIALDIEKYYYVVYVKIGDGASGKT